MMYPMNDHYVLESEGRNLLSLPMSLFSSRDAAERAFYEIEKALENRIQELEDRIEEVAGELDEVATSRIDPDDLPNCVNISVLAKLDPNSPGTLVVMEPVTRLRIVEIPLGCSSQRMLECISALVAWALERAFSEYCGDKLDAPETTFSFGG